MRSSRFKTSNWAYSKEPWEIKHSQNNCQQNRVSNYTFSIPDAACNFVKLYCHSKCSLLFYKSMQKSDFTHQCVKINNKFSWILMKLYHDFETGFPDSEPFKNFPNSTKLYLEHSPKLSFQRLLLNSSKLWQFLHCQQTFSTMWMNCLWAS